MAAKQNYREQAPRFGIGEWYGYRFEQLTNEERLHYADLQNRRGGSTYRPPCPFRADGKTECNKKGGICSLRLYEPVQTEGPAPNELGRPSQAKQGMLRITCPLRFHESNEIFRWVGSVILDTDEPRLAPEIGFLESPESLDSAGGDDVGRIDMVLASADGAHTFNWCAFEIQAVYFSGSAMSREFNAIRRLQGAMIFPAGRRRPDYRSSGPKRLMPQLQIKVPTLRRWGKKMAVVVDRAFFDSLGKMDSVNHLSNCDIAWFIVRLDDSELGQQAKLVRDDVQYTTLERAVEGLTGGYPVAMEEFERRIRAKLYP